MPINPNALSSPEPDPESFSGEPSSPQLPFGGDGQDHPTPPSGDAAEPPKRKRRTKAEMIADAVIPGDAELIEVKDANTGAKVERAWREAVELVKSGAVEFVNKEYKYAALKMEQQAVAPAFSETEADNPYAQPSLERDLDERKSGELPPGATLGDEVRIGADTYRVGHGGVLTSSVVADDQGNTIKPKRRWQRELGAGPDGPWESVVLTQTSEPRPIFDTKQDVGQQQPDDVPVLVNAGAFTPPVAAQNGHSEQPPVTVQTERLPHTQEEIEPGIIKLGTGTLEKIGLPDYSSMQIGPITISRTIVDDGRRTQHKFTDGRTGEVITAAVEAFEVMDNTVEFISARFRGQLVSFLQSTGALKQPVS